MKNNQQNTENVIEVRQCRLDQVKENEYFKFFRNKVIWNAIRVSDFSILAQSEYRTTEFSFNERYRSSSMFNATRADRQVVIVEVK